MNKMNLFGRTVPFLLIVAAIALACPASQPVIAASPGGCVTAVVDAPFRLPDGRLYPAGPLTLCDSGTFSPVESLHRILVGGSAIGLFRSRRRSAETGSMLSPEVVFNRDSDGSLELIGYAVPSSGHSVAYRLRGPGATWQAATASLPLGAASTAPVAAVIAATGTR